MLKRHTTEYKIGNERWLVSYADLVTLLFAFFVVMYSVSQVNEEKYQTLSETLNETFSKQKIRQESDEESGDIETNIDVAAISPLAEDIQKKFSELAVDANIKMSANENWLELTLNSELLFDSGSALTKPSANTVLAELAEILLPFDNEVQITGHTDDKPINNGRFSSNWALSSARAISIVNYLAFQGVQPERMSAIAYGEFRPMADNLTEAGRRQNRRVVVRISSHGVSTERNAIQDETVSTLINERDDNEVDANKRSDVVTELEAETNTMQPVRLKGGDLLFTADPDLPRLRQLEE